MALRTIAKGFTDLIDASTYYTRLEGLIGYMQLSCILELLKLGESKFMVIVIGEGLPIEQLNFDSITGVSKVLGDAFIPLLIEHLWKRHQDTQTFGVTVYKEEFFASN